MKVVADAGAVRSRLVGPVDLQLGSVLGGGGKRQWNQMSLRIGQFANLAAVIGSRSIEIAQTHRAQSEGAAVRLERVFEQQPRCAIGLHRLAQRRLGSRRLL